MIQIDFKMDENVLFNDSKAISEVPDSALDETCFIMPVRLNIDNSDLFKLYSNKDDPYAPLPILNVAYTFFEIVKSLELEKELVYYTPGFAAMKLKLLNDNVLISWPENKIEISINYNEFLAALESFSEKVKKLINERVPKLKDTSPYFSKWLSS